MTVGLWGHRMLWCCSTFARMITVISAIRRVAGNPGRWLNSMYCTRGAGCGWWSDSPRGRAFAICALVVGLLAGRLPAGEPASPKPNIILILADDLGWSDLACYGNQLHETPHLNRLAAHGIRFTDAYAACPVCSPTRACLLTGKLPA